MEVITESLRLKRERSETNVTQMSIEREKHLSTVKGRRERILQSDGYSNK